MAKYVATSLAYMLNKLASAEVEHHSKLRYGKYWTVDTGKMLISKESM